MHAIDPLYSVCGFVGGLLVGMTGVGGGSLMTPLLILLFGVHPATAVGTDLPLCGGHQDWRQPGPRIGSHDRLDRGPTTCERQRAEHGPHAPRAVPLRCQWGRNARPDHTVLSVALFVTAGLLIYRRKLLTFYAARAGELSARRTNRLTFLSGAVLGVLVSISSVGAGAIGVTVLILLYPTFPWRGSSAPTSPMRCP